MLGFALVDHSPEIEAKEGRCFHWCMLRRDGVHLMLNTAYDGNERPDGVDGPRWEGHGDITLYIGCPEVDALHADLVAKGLDLPPPSTAPYGMRQLILRDPDGYAICFQAQVHA